MSDIGPDRQMPEFAVALRGYDRGQVKEYVSALHGFLAEAQRRMAAAEEALAAERGDGATVEATPPAEPTVELPPVSGPPAVPDPTEETTFRILPAGGQQGGTAVTDSPDVPIDEIPAANAPQEPADPLRDLSGAVGDSVARILAEAEQTARLLVEQAQQEPARQLADAEQRLRQLTEQADQEQARRDEVHRQLTELRDLLARTTTQP